MKRKPIPYHPRLKQLARQLRKNSTLSEVLLWKYLNGKQMLGYDFHRQKPIDRFIVDFFCNKLCLAIEVDGYSHLVEEVIEKDAVKEKCLNGLGINVLRFQDSQVMNDIEGVLHSLRVYIEDFEKEHTPGPSRPSLTRVSYRGETRNTPPTPIEN